MALRNFQKLADNFSMSRDEPFKGKSLEELYHLRSYNFKQVKSLQNSVDQVMERQLTYPGLLFVSYEKTDEGRRKLKADVLRAHVEGQEIKLAISRISRPTVQISLKPF